MRASIGLGGRRLRLLALAAALATPLALAGCGDSEDDTPTEEQAPVPPAPIPAEPAPAPAVPEPAAVVPTPVAPVPEPAVTPTPAAVPPAQPAIVPAPAETPAPAPAAPPAPTALPVAPVPAPATAVAPLTPIAEPLVAREDAGTGNNILLLQRLNSADIRDGAEIAAEECGICHILTENGPPIIGPNLYDIIGARIGSRPSFTYSPAMQALYARGEVWTFEWMEAFLIAPQVRVPSTHMTYPGLLDEERRTAVIAYLRSLSNDPVDILPPGAPTVGVQLPGLTPVTFSAQQLSDGHDYYSRYCMVCHGTALQGVWFGGEWGSAPALAGHRFVDNYYDGPVLAIFDAMTAVGDREFHTPLTPERNADILAYILEQNGFTPGETPLPVDRDALGLMGFYQ